MNHSARSYTHLAHFVTACSHYSNEIMSESLLEFVKAIYPYTAQDQGNIGLPLTQSAVVYVAERSEDGWCRGYSKGREGWFPISYTKTIAAAVREFVHVFIQSFRALLYKEETNEVFNSNFSLGRGFMITFVIVCLCNCLYHSVSL